MIAFDFPAVSDPSELEIDGFWYLASPYSAYPFGLGAAHYEASRAAATLVRQGIPVFSPIAHSHPVAMHGQIPPEDHSIWLPADRPFMDAAHGVLVLALTGWDRSHGVKHEIEVFQAAGKPVMILQADR